jgi:ribosome maturation factor RimP
MRDKLLKIAEPVCAGGGYELVDIRYVNEGGWIVRVYIDHGDPDAAGRGMAIGFDDCERISRELSAVFDVEDPLPHAYRLEVSSPGFDRPLRTADHFRRFVGERAKVALTAPRDGRRNYTGSLSAVDEADDGTVITMDVDGERFRLPLEEIASAKLIPDWDRVLSDSQ